MPETNAAPVVDDAPYEAPLVIRRHEDGLPSIKLAGLELRNLLTVDGINIQTVEQFGGGAAFEVTLKFGAGWLDLDFDVDLLQQLLDAKREPGAPRKLGDPA